MEFFVINPYCKNRKKCLIKNMMHWTNQFISAAKNKREANRAKTALQPIFHEFLNYWNMWMVPLNDADTRPIPSLSDFRLYLLAIESCENDYQQDPIKLRRNSMVTPDLKRATVNIIHSTPLFNKKSFSATMRLLYVLIDRLQNTLKKRKEAKHE